MAEAAPFLWSGSGERLTPDAIRRQREIVNALVKQGADYSPVKHWTQGLNRVAQAMLGGYEAGELDRADKANAADDKRMAAAGISALLGGTAADVPVAGASSISTGEATSPGVIEATNPQAAGAGGIAPARAIPGAAGVIPSAKFSGSQGEYVQSMLPAAVEAAGRTGVDPRIIVAQAALESAYGRSAPGNNHFGIKAVGSQSGQTLGTNEVVNGQTVRENARFRTFDSPSDSVAGYGDFILSNGRYGALRQAKGLEAQAAALQASGYATDPAYGRKILGIAKGIALPANAAGGGIVDDPSIPNQGEGIPLPARGVAPVAAALAAQPQTPPAGTTAAADAERVAQAGGPRMVLSGSNPLPLQTTSPADLPAQGAAQADMPAPGASPAAFMIPNPGRDPTVVPTPPEAVAPAQPAAAKVAQALTSRRSPEQNSAIVEMLSSPYASESTRKIGTLLLQKQMEEDNRAQWVERRLDDGSIAQQNSRTGETRVIRAGTDALTQEGKRLDIETKRRALAEQKAPNVQRIKQPDGSEVAVQWDPATGTWNPLKAPEGGNAVKAGPGKLTEQQSKDLVYFNRGIQALEDFEKNPSAYADGTARFAAGLPGGNYLVSESFQTAQQSGRNFLASILRKDSGAAITPNEETIYGAVFLPQPGDKPGVLAQKTAARRQAIEAIKTGLGPAEVLARASELLKGKDDPEKKGQASLDDLLKKYGGTR